MTPNPPSSGIPSGPDPVPDKLTDEEREALVEEWEAKCDTEQRASLPGAIPFSIFEVGWLAHRRWLAARGSVSHERAASLIAEAFRRGWEACPVADSQALTAGDRRDSLERQATEVGTALAARLPALVAAPSRPEAHACEGMEQCRRCGLPANAPVHALSIAALRAPGVNERGDE